MIIIVPLSAKALHKRVLRAAMQYVFLRNKLSIFGVSVWAN